MKLPWSLCPFCGTPEPGKRIEDLTFIEATRTLEVEEVDADMTPEEILEDSTEEEADFSSAEGQELDDLSDEDLISKL